MNQRKTATAETAVGDVGYETIPCANCESDVITDDAVPVFVGGDVNRRADLSYKYEVTWEHSSGVTECALCAYCAESLFGIAEQHGIPAWIGTKANRMDPVPALLLGFLAGMATFVLIVAVAT